MKCVCVAKYTLFNFDMSSVFLLFIMLLLPSQKVGSKKPVLKSTLVCLFVPEIRRLCSRNLSVSCYHLSSLVSFLS